MVTVRRRHSRLSAPPQPRSNRSLTMTSAASGFNDDFLDVLRALVESGAEFVIVGAHALAVHGVPRATGDLDILIRPTENNAKMVIEALEAFGAPIKDHGVSEVILVAEGIVYQLGLPPRRIDLMTGLSGVDFDEAWSTRVEIEIDGMPIPFLGSRRSATQQGSHRS